MPKKQPTKEKTILEKIMDEKPASVQADFLTESLVMDKNVNWKLKLRIGFVMPQCHLSYLAQMVLNEAKFLEDIDKIREQINEIYRDRDLLKETGYNKDRQELKRLEKELEKTEKAFADMKKKCPTIEMTASVCEIKNGENSTTMSLSIPVEAVSKIVEICEHFKNYRIVLTPNYVSDKSEES